jgi:DNA-binding transcriptional MerR regulator
MSAMTIGELARRAQVNVETVRYYERRGLLRVPSRRSSGYRQYAEGDVQRVRTIRRAKHLGFTLGEILQMLPILDQPRLRCSTLKRHAERKVADLSKQILELEHARSALQELVAGCTWQAGSKAPCRAAVSLTTS